MTHIAPITPGELLRDEFLEPTGITAYRVSKSIRVPQTRLSKILKGERAVTADTDLRLCRFFGLSDGYFLRVQAQHDIERERQRIGDELASITPVAA